MLRQAPHTWNISPTYDRGIASIRVGMSYNGANIYAYQYQNLDSDGTPLKAGDLTAGGQTGPGGDSYLYPHFQLDAQATVRVASGFSVLVRSEPDERGVRVLQRKPAVSCSASSTARTFAFGIRYIPPSR